MPSPEGLSGRTWVLYFDGGKQTFSAVTDDKGVMRRFQAEGWKAQARNHRMAGQVEFKELPGGNQDLPF